MIKTIKGKVIAGTLVFGLVAGGGVALGATDAGAGLKSWYDGHFKQSTVKIAKDTFNHSKTEFEGLADDVGTLKSGATSSINGTRDTATTEATGRIHQEGRDYISSVNDAKWKIEGTIDSEFDKIEMLAKQALDATGKVALRLAEFDLKRHTGKEGKAALAHLETKITEQTNQSISELEWEIRTTKLYLIGLLDEKSGKTIVNINNAVDAEIARLLELITTKTNTLVAEQQTLITNKAVELESAAKVTLEQKVNELINE